MSAAYINAFDNVDNGGYGRGAQCFDGYCQEQARADVNPTTAWPGAPHLTVTGGTRYVEVYLTAPGLIYAGPALANNAADVVQWQARGVAKPAGLWPLAGLEAGHVVAIKDL